MRGRGLCAVLALMCGCANGYQTARMLPRGSTSVTSGMTSYRPSEELGDGIDTAQVRVSHGLSDAVELGGTIGKFGDTTAVGLSPKFSISPDRLALALDIGTLIHLGEGENQCCTFVVPNLIWSGPVNPQVEVTGSAKVGWVFEDGENDSFLGASVGLRLSTDLSKWAFHPEIGLSRINDDDADSWFTAGAAFSFVL